MNKIIAFCIIFSQSFLIVGCPRLGSKPNEQSVSNTAVARIDSSRTWHAATYRGLTMGRSNVQEMRRVLGAPKRSEVFNDGKSNPEVWYYYGGASEFPGTLRVIVNKSSNTIQAVDIQPQDLSKEEAIKHFGPDYVITRYDFDSCLGDEESAPLFESPSGSVIFIEYRQRGIAIAVDSNGKVNEITYVSEPIGAESSKCERESK
jgi:hypothetical protein